jgi:hypothetical protein
MDVEPKVEQIALPNPRSLTPKERALIDFCLQVPSGETSFVSKHAQRAPWAFAAGTATRARDLGR